MLSNNKKVSSWSRGGVLLPAARVRGIYTTALTKLLLDHGFEMVQPSVTIKERFRLRETEPKSIPDLDICDSLDKQGICVGGETDSLEVFISVLQSSLDDAIIRRRVTNRKSDQTLLPYDSMVEDAQGGSSGSRRDSVSVEFPAMSKKGLDAIRSLVAPTIEDHHHLKACGGKMSYLLEMAEKMLEKGAPRSEVEKLLAESIMAEYPRLNTKMNIEHVKIDGRVFHLNNAEIVYFDEDERSLQLRRTFRSRGTYDGLRIRKDPDDYALTDLRVGDWLFQTRYFSSEGRYKGTYVNMNTPIELYPDKIRYVDLEVDVCLWPDGKIERLDLDKLEGKAAEGYVSEKLVGIVKRKLKEVIDSASHESWGNKGSY